MNKLIAFFGKVFAGIVAYSPRKFQVFLGHSLGLLWFDVLRIRRSVVLENIAKAFPELDARSRMKIARTSMKNLGLTIVEFNLFPFFDKSWLGDYIEFRGLEHLSAAQANGKGAFILGLHLANGDLAMLGLSLIDFPVYLISKTFKSKWLNNLWFGLRSKHGTQFIEDRKSSFDILRVLRKNGRVVFVMDQYTGRPLGIKTKFFNIETGTAAGLALFAGRTGSPVIPSFCYRDSHNKAIVCFEAPMTYIHHDDRDEAIRLNTQAYNDVLENIVRRFPEQWMWVHKRWKVFRED